MAFSFEDDAIRVYNDGRPIHLSSFTLHCRHWSHFKNATCVTLSQLVDIEIQGIPTQV
jgi:hypothetical protein